MNANVNCEKAVFKLVSCSANFSLLNKGSHNWCAIIVSYFCDICLVEMNCCFVSVSGVTLVFCYSTVLLLPLLLTTSIGTTAAIEEDDSQGGREGTTWPVSFSLANFATSKYNRPPIVIAPPLSDKDDQEGADDSAVNYVKADCFANGDPSPKLANKNIEKCAD